MSVIKHDLTSGLKVKCSADLQKVTSTCIYDSNSQISEELDFEDYKDQSNLSILIPPADKVRMDHNSTEQVPSEMQDSSIEKADAVDGISVIDGEILDDEELDHIFTKQNSGTMQITNIEKTDAADVISVIDDEILDEGELDDHSSIKQDSGTMQNNSFKKTYATHVNYGDEGEILDDGDLDDHNSVTQDSEIVQNSSIIKTDIPGIISDADGEILDDGELNDIEEGEIKDNSSDLANNLVCRFFQTGRCRWGNKCRFLHVNDKGLYNMFDLPSGKSCLSECRQSDFLPSNESYQYVYNKNKCYNTGDVSYFSKDVPCGESAWDKALAQAKENIEKSKKKKEEEDFEEKKMYLSPDKSKVINEDSYNRKHFPPKSNFNSEIKKINVVQTHIKKYCKELPVQDRGTKFKKQDYVKSHNKNIVQKTDHLTWRDPWRRSKSPKFSKFSTSRSRSLSSSSSSSSVHSYSVTSSSSSYSSRSYYRSYSRSPVRNKRKELTHKLKRSSSPRWSRDRRSTSKSRSFSRMYSKHKSGWRSSSKSSIYSEKSNKSFNSRHQARSFSTPKKSRKISQTRISKVQCSPKSCSLCQTDSEIHSPSNACCAVYSASTCYSSDMSISPVSSPSSSPLRRKKKNCAIKTERDVRLNDESLQRNNQMMSINSKSIKNRKPSRNEVEHIKPLIAKGQQDLNKFSNRKVAESENMSRKMSETSTGWTRTVRREVVKSTSSIKELCKPSVNKKRILAKPVISRDEEKLLKYHILINNKGTSHNTASGMISSNNLRHLNEDEKSAVSKLKSNKNGEKLNVLQKPNESKRDFKTSRLFMQSIDNIKKEKSKREELLKQLKAIEEAIARKREH